MKADAERTRQRVEDLRQHAYDSPEDPRRFEEKTREEVVEWLTEARHGRPR